VENVLSMDSVHSKFVGQNVKVMHHHCVCKCWITYRTSIICGPKFTSPVAVVHHHQTES